MAVSGINEIKPFAARLKFATEEDPFVVGEIPVTALKWQTPRGPLGEGGSIRGKMVLESRTGTSTPYWTLRICDGLMTKKLNFTESI